MPSQPSKRIEFFSNPSPERDYLVHLEVPEFTCLCPLTGQPDFAQFEIDYVPDRRNVELKSLKQYMWSFRNEGAFHEAISNRILQELATSLSPRFMRLTARWYVRGGIFTSVVVEHRKKNWKGSPLIGPPEWNKQPGSYR
jgi:7-cyano-7-deazaguanine reductase